MTQSINLYCGLIGGKKFHHEANKLMWLPNPNEVNNIKTKIYPRFDFGAELSWYEFVMTAGFYGYRYDVRLTDFTSYNTGNHGSGPTYVHELKYHSKEYLTGFRWMMGFMTKRDHGFGMKIGFEVEKLVGSTVYENVGREGVGLNINTFDARPYYYNGKTMVRSIPVEICLRKNFNNWFFEPFLSWRNNLNYMYSTRMDYPRQDILLGFRTIMVFKHLKGIE